MEKDNVHSIPQTIFERELDADQEAYWCNVLENCERGVDYAQRMLKIGKYASEKSFEE